MWVGGRSLLARLLRSTIGALNTSSETVLESNNLGEQMRGPPHPNQASLPGTGIQGHRGGSAVLGVGSGASASLCLCLCPACLPQPRHMEQGDYMASCLPLGVLVLLCLLQVYTHRLRRVIAAFFFPKVRPCPRLHLGS